MNKSSIKTWCRRNGMKLNRWTAWREWRGYGTMSGRPIRVRWHEHRMDMGDPSRPVVRWTKLPEPVVDIGERPETFDRWANSTERTVSWNDFVSLFKKGYP